MKRSRFDEFVSLRSNNNNNNNNNNSDTGSQSINNTKTLSWMSIVEEIKVVIIEIKSKIKLLNEVHKEHFYNIFDGNSTFTTIEYVSDDISRKIMQVKTKINLIDKIDSITNDENKLKKNIKQMLTKDIYACFEEFKQLQNSFVNDVEIMKKRTKNSLEEIVIDNYNDNNNNNNINSIDNAPMTNISLIDDGDKMMLIERNKELQIIEKNVRNLAELFNDVAILVDDQGIIIDRIDYNIETASTNTELGVKEITEAEVSTSTSRTRSCILLLIVLLIIMIILLIIKFTTKKSN